MSRLPNRPPFYYWRSKATGVRVGWVFPSRVAAYKWLYDKYWKYLDYPVIDNYLKTVPSRKRKWAPTWWRKCRDQVEDLELARGYLHYIRDEGKGSKAEDPDLETWKRRNKRMVEQWQKGIEEKRRKGIIGV
jgi:hypothetical protein